MPRLKAPHRIHHLEPKEIERAGAGGAAAARLLVEALRHLSDTSCGCTECQETLAAYPLDAVAERAGGGYGHGFEEAMCRVRRLEEDLAEGERLLAEVLEMGDVGRWECHLLSNPRYMTLGVGMMLLAYADEAVDGDAEPVLGVTEIAVCIGESLREARCGGRRLVEDFRALARTKLAASQRKLGRLGDAQDNLSHAEAHLKKGTRSRGIEGAVVLERARWWLAKARPAVARELAVRVEQWSERIEEDGQQREAMLVIARAKRLAGEFLEAITELKVLVAMAREAKVAPADEARFRLELVGTLYEAGELDAAREQIARLRVMESVLQVPHVAARTAWWSGMVEAEAGRLEEATEELDTAWRALAREGLGLEAVGAGLALASLYVERDRQEELGRLGEELPDLVAIGGFRTGGWRHYSRLSAGSGRATARGSTRRWG